MPNRNRTEPVRGARLAWAATLRTRMLAALLAASQLLLAGGSVAHEGHDHDKPAPLNMPVAPRVVAVTPDYELVGVLSGEQRLTIFLHRFATNEPVKNATLSVGAGESEVEAVSKEDGVFEVSAAWVAAAGPLDLTFRLTLPDDQDILTGRLERAGTVSGAGSPAPLTGTLLERQTFLVAAGAFMAGVLLTLLIGASLARRRRPLVAERERSSDGAEPAGLTLSKVKQLQRASIAVLAALLAALGLVSDGAMAAESLKLPSVPSTMATDQPQRMPDASLFVPKATQHLLAVRTILATETRAPRTVQLVGTVIADPNSFGRVQSARPGRIEAPPSGLAFIGKRVEKGELLGILLPYIEAADKANIESEIAATEARIVKLATILSRYNERPGAMPQVKVDEVEGELNALRRKRAELQPSLVAREEIRAPITGTVSAANVVAGQIVEAREVLFEIVDPARSWVEAIAHDASVASNLSKAFAVTHGGERLALEFSGMGPSLKQQASPLMFRVVDEAPANLGVGKPVTVILQSTLQVSGIVLPASSVVRAPSGLPTVWVKSEAERFEPHTVRYEPLDGQRVLVSAGLKADMRVVTEGATLLNQIR